MNESRESYPWRLRLVHEGHSSIRVERPGRWFRFVPFESPAAGEQCVLTWNELERAQGVLKAIEQGLNPQVVASAPLRGWLEDKGKVQAQAPGASIDGVQVEAMEYTPIPYATPPEALRKTRAALLNPAMAARRLFNRVGLPKAQPLVVQLTFEDGSRLLHLNCALHRDTPQDWLKQARERFAGADWIIVGIDYDEDEAVLELLPGFEGKLVLVADLVNDARRRLGLPTRILTPTVDLLRERGVEAHPFVEGACHRYE